VSTNIRAKELKRLEYEVNERQICCKKDAGPFPHSRIWNYFFLIWRLFLYQDILWTLWSPVAQCFSLHPLYNVYLKEAEYFSVYKDIQITVIIIFSSVNVHVPWFWNKEIFLFTFFYFQLTYLKFYKTYSLIRTIFSLGNWPLKQYLILI